VENLVLRGRPHGRVIVENQALTCAMNRLQVSVSRHVAHLIRLALVAMSCRDYRPDARLAHCAPGSR
jgi:hypothetical protein